MFRFLSRAQRQAVKKLADEELKKQARIQKEEWDNQRFQHIIAPLEKFRKENAYVGGGYYIGMSYRCGAVVVNETEYKTIQDAILILKRYKDRF